MSGRRRIIASALIVTGALLSSTVGASTGPDDSARNNDWVGLGAASGFAAVEQEGVTVAWDGKLNVVFKYNVNDAGLAAGTWILRGEGAQLVEFQGFEAFGDLLYGGSGTLGGDESTLVANGSVSTVGVIEPFGQDVNNESSVGPLKVAVETFCDEMWGSWELTVENAFQDAGFSGEMSVTEFDGLFVAHVKFEGFSDEAIDLLAEQGIDMALLDSVAADYSIAERVDLDLERMDAHILTAVAATQRLKDTYPDWAEPDVYEAVESLRGLLNVLRNLSDCSRFFIGEDEVEYWTDNASQSLERVIDDLLGLDLFTGEPIQPQGFASSSTVPVAEPVDTARATLAYLQLVDFSMRSAVIGAGALDPAAAAQSEQALIAAGSRLLAGLDARGGTPGDRRRVLLAGALMGWQFEVAGAPVDAAAALADLEASP